MTDKQKQSPADEGALANPLETHGEQSFVLIKPHATYLGSDNEIRMIVERNRFWILSTERLVLTADAAREFLLETRRTVTDEEIISFVGACVLLVVAKDNAINDLRKLCGDDDPTLARIGTLHRMFGIDRHANGTYSPSTAGEFVKGFGVLRAWRDLYYAAIKGGSDDALDMADHYVKRITGQPGVEGEETIEEVAAPELVVNSEGSGHAEEGQDGTT